MNWSLRSWYWAVAVYYWSVGNLCDTSYVPYESSGSEYNSYISRIAQARLLHERKVFEDQKNEIYDYTPPKMRYAVEESDDHWINKFNNRYADAAQQYAKVKNPKPVVDTASKDELAGTTKPLPSNRIIVDLFEGFSRFLNQLIEKPLQIIAKAWNKGLKGLDGYGGKLLNIHN